MQKQGDECKQLWENLDHLEQYSRKNSLEIHGVPQDSYTSTEHVVIKVAEALNITMEPEEIEISHKINESTSILVKFCSHKTKSKIYKERIKLKQVKIRDLFPTYNPSTAQHRIFINLTAFKRCLVEAANRRRKDRMLFSMWTLDGKVYVKTSPSGTLIRIHEKKIDLDHILLTRKLISSRMQRVELCSTCSPLYLEIVGTLEMFALNVFSLTVMLFVCTFLCVIYSSLSYYNCLYVFSCKCVFYILVSLLIG